MQKNHMCFYFFLYAISHCLMAKEVITNIKKTDGFGAQTQQIITAYLYASLNGLDFVYTPFETMEHNYNDDPRFIELKEWLINFKNNFETADEAIKKGDTVHTDNYAFYFDANVAICAVSPALKKMKEIFRSNKNIDNYFGNQKFNIAVHIRRPNLHDNRVYGTDVPDDIYEKVISKLRIIHAAKDPLFHIYSQGDLGNFEKFLSDDVILHINEPLEDTYIGMVLADALVTGRSSLSYTAGYLSDGIVYYVSYPHAPLPDWIAIETLIQN